MESLGPLIKSSAGGSDVPRGEDGACSMSDGASVDAVSYSYLKLEQEFKNQQLMVKSLERFEELLRAGWTVDAYRKSVANCLKSLGYYFGLCGNSLFSFRAWTALHRLSSGANSDEEYLLSVCELLKLRWTPDACVLVKCQEMFDEKKKLVIGQDMVLYYLSLAWSKYYQQSFEDSWRILQARVFGSSLFSTDAPTKSVLVLQAQSYHLQSLLLVLPPAICPQIQWTGRTEVGPGALYVSVKGTQSGYTGFKCYANHARDNNGVWEFHGLEWYVLGVFITCAVHTARLHLYTV